MKAMRWNKVAVLKHQIIPLKPLKHHQNAIKTPYTPKTPQNPQNPPTSELYMRYSP
jgi:hypothetical protein